MGLSGIAMTLYDSGVVPCAFRWTGVKLRKHFLRQDLQSDQLDSLRLPTTSNLHLSGIYYEDLRHHVFSEPVSQVTFLFRCHWKEIFLGVDLHPCFLYNHCQHRGSTAKMKRAKPFGPNLQKILFRIRSSREFLSLAFSSRV